MAAGVEVLIESRDVRVRVGSDARIVLVVILELNCVLRTGDVVKIGDCLVRPEVRGAWNERVVRNAEARRARSPRNQILAVRKFGLEERQGDGIDLGCGKKRVAVRLIKIRIRDVHEALGKRGGRAVGSAISRSELEWNG